MAHTLAQPPDAHQVPDHILHSVGKSLALAEARARILDQVLPDGDTENGQARRQQRQNEWEDRSRKLDEHLSQAQEALRQAHGLLQAEEDEMRRYVERSQIVRHKLESWGEPCEPAGSKTCQRA